MMIEQFGFPRRAKSTAAETNAATPDFMSPAPRPQSKPSLISAANGSTLQSDGFPAGTTSVCPLNPKVRPFLPLLHLANRFDMPPRSAREQSNPSRLSSDWSSPIAPASAGVTDGHLTSSAVSSTGSIRSGIAVALRYERCVQPDRQINP